MNDIKSLLIATTVLAIGGLGLYMYKSENDEFDDNDDDFTESGSELESELDLDLDNLEEEELEDLDNYSPKKSKKGTKKNIKKKSGTRKKY